MLRTLGSGLLLIALMGSLNLHWAVLQGVAWAGMFSRETQRAETFQEALERTFGGDYPCDWCGMVEDNLPGKQSATTEQALEKIKLLPLAFVRVSLEPLTGTRYGEPGEERTRALALSPATPPPRA